MIMNRNNIKLFDTWFASMTCSLFLTVISCFLNFRHKSSVSANDIVEYGVDVFIVTMISIFIPLLIYNLLISPRLYKYKGLNK